MTQNEDKFKKYKTYAEKVINGDIVAGEFIRLSCKRYLSWFDRDDYEFRPDKADRPVKFISKLKHTEGKFFNKPFILQDWQEFLVYGMFGFYHKGTNKRVIRNTYVQISRKCGKTSLASALALYGLIADGEQGAEIDFVSPSAEQTRIGFRSAANYAESINQCNLFKCLRNVITSKVSKGRIRMMTSDAKLGDGFNPHFAIVDEYHSLINDDVPNVLMSGMGMRENPMMIYITTAGFNLSSACKEYRDMCVSILQGNIQDDTIFPLIYELDEGDDWKNSKVWKKACPSLGITVTEDYMKQQVTMAYNKPSNETAIKTKNLNMWCSSREVWLSDELLRSVMTKIDLSAYTGMYCSLGIDLASTSDLCSLSMLISHNNELIFKTWCFVPEDTYNDCENTQLYAKFKRNGHLIITPGNVCDYDYICNLIHEINNICPVQNIYYDAYNSTQFIIQLTEHGFQCSPYSQSLGAYNKPTKEFERRVLSNNVKIDYNDCVLWCFQNTTLKYDHNDNCKPVKGASRKNKIDAVISMLTALGGMLQDPTYSNEIWVC